MVNGGFLPAEIFGKVDADIPLKKAVPELPEDGDVNASSDSSPFPHLQPANPIQWIDGGELAESEEADTDSAGVHMPIQLFRVDGRVPGDTVQEHADV
ncbi:hypothetical protein EDD17DRAFT_1766775 [Pisolithus thermaeus]|nr:hypothetical protein EDD17DRAFT_1766775 [Pisolithus thermaeus]